MSLYHYKKRVSILNLAILTLLLGLCFFALDALNTNKRLLLKIEEDIQQDLDRILEDINTLPYEKLANYKLQSGLKLIVLDYSYDAKLLRWNTNQFIPSPGIVRSHILQKTKRLIEENNSTYYVHKTYTDSLVHLCLIPLKVSYPWTNDYLQRHVFMGRYNSQFAVKTAINNKNIKFIGHHVSTANQEDFKLPAHIYISDKESKTLFTLKINSLYPYRLYHRLAAVILLSLGFICFLFFINRTLQNRNISPLYRHLIIAGAIVLLRFLLWWFRLPASYIDTPFFSPRLLAIDDLNSSLGELSLTILTVFYTVYGFFRTISPKKIALWLSRRSKQAFPLYFLLAVPLACLLFYYYFFVFRLVTLNTTVYYKLTDLSGLSLFTPILYIDIGLVLFTVFLVHYLIAGICVYGWQYIKYKPYVLIFLTLMVVSILIWSFSVSMTDFLLQYALILVYTFVLVFVRLTSTDHIRQGLLSAISLIGILALVSAFALSDSVETSSINILKQTARTANQRDLQTESTFNLVVQTIQQDSSLWFPSESLQNQSDPLDPSSISRITNNHLSYSIKDYEIQIFIFNSFGRRMDKNDKQRPIRLSAKQKNSPEYQTESDYLWLSYSKGMSRKIYIGSFKVDHNFIGYAGSGKLTVQIELRPKAVTHGKIYKKLLMDKNLYQRITPPNGYKVGIYRQGKLLETRGNRLSHDYQNQLPATLLQYTKSGRNDTLNVSHPDYYEYLHFQNTNLAVLARVARTGVFSSLTAFSFLFYVFGLLYLFIRLPDEINRFHFKTIRIMSNSFVVRIELLLVGMSLLPLLVVWFITSDTLKTYFNTDTDNRLSLSIEQVANVLKNKPAYLAQLQSPETADYPSSRELLDDISNILSSDVNIYNSEGKLYLTSVPKYSAYLTAKYINPQAFKQMTGQQTSRLLLTEHIGKLSFRSGYIALRASNNSIAGFLNIPYSTQEEVISSQIDRFLSYFINVYVILILILVLAGIFFTKTLTNPLKLLRNRMDQTNLGLYNEPIQWNTTDEIGLIISSYNQMLQKLAESEKKLTKSERDFAWKNMAKQVAHEIKNPLTPMKLSIQQLLRKLTSADIQPEKVKNIADTLLAQIESLTEIANSFSEFASMPKYNISKVCLNDVLVNIHTLYIDNSETEMHVNLPDEEVFIQADKNKLQRVFVNLVQNAMQATESNNDLAIITLSLKIENGNAIVSVQDNGEGIATDHQARVFEPNFSTKNSGMGLGLAMTRRIVENMSGTIRFNSTLHVGTTFQVVFPLG